MKIAISGTHGIGKTTLAYSLVGALKEKGYHAGVSSEKVRECPLPTGTEKNNSVAAETWILGKQIIDEIELERKYPLVVCDRSVLCIYPYFLWNLKKESHLKDSPMAKISKNIFKNWVGTYDYIFKLPIIRQSKLNEDGFRSTEKNWQIEIDEILEKIIEKNKIKVHKIPPDKNEKRVQKIIEILRRDLEKLN